MSHHLDRQEPQLLCPLLGFQVLGYCYKRDSIVCYFWFGAYISFLCKQSLCNEIDDKVSEAHGMQPIAHFILLQSLFLFRSNIVWHFLRGCKCSEGPQILELDIAWQVEKKPQIQIKCLICVTDWIPWEADSERNLYVACLLRNALGIVTCGRLKK